MCGGLGCIVGRFGSLLDHRRTLQPPLVFMLLFQLLLQLLLAVRTLGGLLATSVLTAGDLWAR